MKLRNGQTILAIQSPVLIFKSEDFSGINKISLALIVRVTLSGDHCMDGSGISLQTSIISAVGELWF